MTDVVVVGAGLNGLVAGAWLARQKLSTLVLDRRPVAGGAAITAEFQPGYRAPALAHSLGPVSRDVVRALRLDKAGLEFITPDPCLTTFGRSGETIVFHRDSVLTAGAINAVSPADAGRWRQFLQTSHRISGLLSAINRHPAPPMEGASGKDIWRLLNVGRRARSLGARDLARLARWVPMSVSDVLDEWFENELLRAAIATRAVFGNFVGPRSAGTGAMLLQRLAEDPLPVGSGVTVRGGPGALSQALVGIAQKAGAQVRTGARVARIDTRHGRVRAVVLEDGEEIPTRAVVAAVGPRHALLDLVDPADLPPTFLERARNIRSRGVTAKVNLALSSAPNFPALHGDVVPLGGRFLIAPDLDTIERAFDASKYGELSPEPWLELSLPTIADPALAPPNRHVLSVYVHYAPRHLRNGTWPEQRQAIYKAVAQTLSPHLPDFDAIVVDGEVLTPEDLEKHWGLPGGHIFHGESTLDQFWFARPMLGWAQYRTPIEGLYLGSAGTHPGGGLTGASGLLAAQTVAGDLKKKT